MPTLNAGKYAELVAERRYAPGMIESGPDYRRAKNVLERLLFPERKLSVEEDAMAKVLLHLIDVYEIRTAIPPKTTPRELLQHLMEQRHLKQRDLAGVLGTASVVSEVLSGKREINARQARRLADYFELSADLFV